MKKTNVIFLNQWDLAKLEKQVNENVRNIEKSGLEITDIKFKHCCSTVNDPGYPASQQDSYSVMIIYKAEDWEIIRDIENEEREIKLYKAKQGNAVEKYKKFLTENNLNSCAIDERRELLEKHFTQEELDLIREFYL